MRKLVITVVAVSREHKPSILGENYAPAPSKALGAFLTTDWLENVEPAPPVSTLYTEHAIRGR
jgi:hypothetical protein